MERQACRRIAVDAGHDGHPLLSCCTVQCIPTPVREFGPGLCYACRGEPGSEGVGCRAELVAHGVGGRVTAGALARSIASGESWSAAHRSPWMPRLRITILITVAARNKNRIVDNMWIEYGE